MIVVLLLVSLVNVALQVVTYRRARPGGLMDDRAAAAISGVAWLGIAAWCVVQLLRPV